MHTKSVLITGCSSGIGAQTARHLVAKGYQVFASARKVDTLQGLQALGCHTLELDVTDEASMKAAVDYVQAKAGGIGALVNNAGYSLSGALETLPMDAVRAQFETNVFGLLRLTQLVLPAMRQARAGRIVNLSSMGGKLTFPGGGAYHATKHAVEALSDALRFEVRGFGIQVVVIEPGLIRTGFAAAASKAMPQAAANDPYASFNAAVETATRDVYEKGPLAALGGGPDAVARVIETALSASKPKARYTVTPSATLLLTQRRLMSDGAWDGFLRGNFPSPGAAS